jgi:hypothetical protein
MHARNLLFIAICAAALWAFKVSIFPATAVPLAAPPADADSIRETASRVDRAFDRLWSDQQIAPAAAADELAVARRISLGLTGTIPSLEEIRRFEALPAEARLDVWLNERLADRRSADYLAERLARAYVGVDDGPFLLFRRRRFVSWLADQLAAGKAYDVLVRHLISDTGLWTDTPATNFITVTIQPDNDRGPDPNQLAARVSRAFLGVRIDCAECHDHPFESWKQRDFQGLAAFFGQTKNSLRGIRDADGTYQVENRQTGEMETISCNVPFAKELLGEDGTDRQRLARWVTHPENRAFAREAVNRAWALLFGRPLVKPIDNLPSGNLPEALDILADDFVAHRYDMKRLLSIIAGTRVFRLDSRLATDQDAAAELARHEAAWAVFPLTRLRPEQVVGALLQSASLATIDSESHIVVRLARAVGQNEFIKRYGDSGAEEFDDLGGGTIPQRLLLMNGQLVEEKTKDSLLANAATRIAAYAPDDAAAVETALLAVLSRRPTAEERKYFERRLAEARGSERSRRVGDLVWTLVNSTEFSWNH